MTLNLTHRTFKGFNSCNDASGSSITGGIYQGYLVQNSFSCKQSSVLLISVATASSPLPPPLVPSIFFDGTRKSGADL